MTNGETSQAQRGTPKGTMRQTKTLLLTTMKLCVTFPFDTFKIVRSTLDSLGFEYRQNIHSESKQFRRFVSVGRELFILFK